MNRYNNKKAFTLIELLVVIAIIGVLSTMAIIALGNARAKARDSKRVADIKQISTALELYYADSNSYPTLITPGNSLTSPDGTKVYMASVPNNPTPRNDSGCGNNNYTYASTSDNTNYSLNFCLGNNVASTPAGINSSSSSGFNTAPGLVGWWKFDEGTGSSLTDLSGNNNTGTWYGTGTHYTAGKTGAYAGQFNGTDDRIALGSSSTLSMATSDWTILAWVKTSSNAVIELCAGVGTGLWQFYLSGGRIYGYLNDGVGALSFYSSPGISDGNWHQVGAVFSRAGNGQTYVDGAVSGTPTNISSIGNVVTNNHMLGAYSPLSLYFLPGLMDDVRIYNRALSAAEILALYNAAK
ncbi:MAG: prepilin-type N-terminal cleavage/methylation domain-containing protein [Candidatus Falkowbacteria bacterium]|nr:prepilin-type N-terminal cleavage/methylation domain-containing protein [Candidatus Falkowbacteria bacterium]